jgi:hypothetical protein
MSESEHSDYWFGFRQISPKPPGRAVPCGPYHSREDAMRERERMKAWDAAVSVPFTAQSEEEAMVRAEELTGSI